jgi:hypothetical protein
MYVRRGKGIDQSQAQEKNRIELEEGLVLLKMAHGRFEVLRSSLHRILSRVQLRWRQRGEWRWMIS